VRQRIDEESRVVDEHRAEDTRLQQASPRVPYSEADGERHAEAHVDRERDVVTVLKAGNGSATDPECWRKSSRFGCFTRPACAPRKPRLML
jgi:hypothetical protein